MDPPRARASGPAPDRVLAIGGALLAGEGVLTHDLALTGAIARGLARRVGHGFDVTSCIDERGGVDGALRAIRNRTRPGSMRSSSCSTPASTLLTPPSRRGEPVGSPRSCGRDSPRRRASPSWCRPSTVARARDVGAAFREAVERESGALTRVVRLADRVFVPSAAERYAIWGEAIARPWRRAWSIRSSCPNRSSGSTSRAAFMRCSVSSRWTSSGSSSSVASSRSRGTPTELVAHR